MTTISQPTRQQTNQFENGLFEMWKDPDECCYVCALTLCCLECCHAAQASYMMDGNMFDASVQACAYPCGVPCLRMKARKIKNIEGSKCNDIWVGLCCPLCATFQIVQEFKPNKTDNSEI